MRKNFPSAASFAAATIVVFGVIYLIDGHNDSPDKPKPMQEIKGSVGPVWAIDEARLEENPGERSAGQAQGSPDASSRARCEAWEKHDNQLAAFERGSSAGAERDRIRQARKKVRQEMLDLDCR